MEGELAVLWAEAQKHAECYCYLHNSVPFPATWIRRRLLQMTDELGDHLHTSCFARPIRKKTGSKIEKSLVSDFGFNNFMRD